MKDTKLLRYYRTFSVEEAKEWLTFVQSPYFNTNPNVVSLAKIMRSYHPDLHQSGLAKEKIYRRIYGKETYQDIKMRKLMSAGVKLIERYWVVKETKADDLLYSAQLSKALRKQELFKDYQKKMFQLILDHEVRVQKKPDSLHDLHQLHWNLAADRQFLSGIDLVSYLEKATDYLAQHQDQQVLLHYLLWRDIKNVAGHEIPTYLREKVQNITHSENNPHVKILQYIYQLGEESKFQEHLYKKTTKYLVSVIDNIDADIKYYVFRLLINYLLYHQRNGSDVEDHYLKIMLLSIEYNALIYRGKISVAIYINLAIELSRNELFQEAYSFIRSHNSFLEGHQANMIKDLAQSYILFHQQQYKESYELSSSFYFTSNMEPEIPRRTIQLQAAISSKDIRLDAALSVAMSFDKFIRRNSEISAAKKSALLNLIKLNRRICLTIKDSNSKLTSRSRLIEDIKKSSQLSIHLRKWMLSLLQK